jgi:hypothetical protein
MVRRCIGLLLSVAFASAPLIALQCEVACATAHTIAGESSAHTAHHPPGGPTAVSARFTIGQEPGHCGRDHTVVAVIAASADASGARPVTLVIVAAPPALSIPAGMVLARDASGSSSPPGGFLLAPSPLRI